MTDTDTSDGSRPRLYGRRQGRKLRLRKAGLMESLLPQVRLTLPADGTAVDPATWFPQPHSQFWLEIGFGGGEHLAAQAAANPTIGMVGCEPFTNGVAGLLSQIDSLGLTNVRIFPDDARLLLPRLPAASIERCFVLFADPWPKARHHERRFIGPANLTELSRILADDAELRLASDDPGLVSWMLEHTWRHPDFEWLARRAADWRDRPADWPPTRYEQKALAAGRVPVFLSFRRRPRRLAMA